MKKKLIIIIFTVLIVFLSLAGVVWNFFEFFTVSSIDNLTVPDQIDIKPMYLVKNIDVAENGSILISTNNGIFMFNSNGKCVTFLKLSMNFKFKVDQDRLIVVREENSGIYKQCYCDIYLIYKDSLAVESSHKINLNYEDYCNQNNFENNKIINKMDVEYQYKFYGKVRIARNGNSKVLNLEKVYFPLSGQYILVFDGLLFIVFISYKIYRKVKK